MERQVVYDGADLCAIARDGPDFDGVIVTFTPWSAEPIGNAPAADVKGFGDGAFAKRGVAEFHVVARKNHWYQTPEIEPVIEAAAAFIGGRAAISYGGSMGGYAAINFAGILGTRFFALSPQMTIDRTAAPFEKRWRAEAAAITYRWDYIRNGLPSVQGVLFYDPRCEPDRLQADAILQRTGGVAVVCPFAGHAVPAHVHAVAPLAELSLSYLRRTFEPSTFARLRRARRCTDSVYLSTLLEACYRRGHHWPISRISDAFAKLSDVPLRDLRRLCMALIAGDRVPEARDVLDRALAAGGSDASACIILADMHFRLGDDERCRELILAGLQKAPNNPRLVEMFSASEQRLHRARLKSAAVASRAIRGDDRESDGPVGHVAPIALKAKVAS